MKPGFSQKIKVKKHKKKVKIGRVKKAISHAINTMVDDEDDVGMSDSVHY